MAPRVALSLAALALGLSSCVANAAAAGGVEFAASMEPARVAFPKPSRLVYRLDMQSGGSASGRPYRFSVLARPPVYGRNAGRDEGAPLQIHDVRLEGAATSSSGVKLHVLPSCSPHTDVGRTEPRYPQFSWHGYEPEARGVDVTLPPNSAGAVVIEAEAGRAAPWTTLDWRLPFEITPARQTSFEFEPPETVPAQTVRPVAARVTTPRTGVQIVLTTKPPSAVAPFAEVPKIRRGQAIAIRGRTYPAVPGARIRLRYFGPRDDRSAPFRNLARVEVGRRGRFAYDGWTPKERGRYELWAFYKSDRRNLLSDHRCPRVFEVSS